MVGRIFDTTKQKILHENISGLLPEEHKFAEDKKESSVRGFPFCLVHFFVA